jgi:glutamine synthetase
MTTSSDVLNLIKEKEVKYVDFRFCDTRGKEQHVTQDVRRLLDCRLEGHQ